MRVSSLLGLAVVVVAVAAASVPASAQTIIDDWAKIQAPPPPKVEPQQLDATTTAVLALDFVKQICVAARTPRCVASVPKVAALLAKARAAGAMVVYSRFANTTEADIDPALAPQAGDPDVVAGVDKFVGTNLAQLLKDKGIQTVVVTGVAANGAVLYTASDAAIMGMNVVVPIDGMSAADPYAEQYTAWNMVNAPLIAAKSKLATIDGITFK